MRNGINYTGTYSGGGGGTSFDTVLTAGQISSADPGVYMSASFNDVSSKKYVAVRIYTEDSGTMYYGTYMIAVEHIPTSGEISFNVALLDSNRNSLISVACAISRTTIRSHNYSGTWRDIYADIIGTTDELFPV